MNRLVIFLSILLLNFALSAHAQVRSYLVRFIDKRNSTFSVNRPQDFLTLRAIDRRSKQNIRILESDLPVNQTYLTQLQQTGAKVIYPTRWFNGALIEADQATLNRVNQLSFVRKDNVTRLNRIENEGGNKLEKDEIPPNYGRIEEDYGTSLPQIRMLGIDKMHEDGFRGENIHIAVIDDGFQNLNANPLFRQSKILGTYNFDRRSTDVYNNISSTHGTRVLSQLAALQAGQLIGTAYNASYYLFMTENNNPNIENKIEEINWVFAAERADSLGVDIISTSLGYSTFDDATLNYTVNDLDGKTALISQAAAIATRVGMIVVKSAGNQGTSAWRRVTFPGDVDSILTVGSLDGNSNYVSSSSRGRTVDGRIKPDVVAMGGNAIVGFPNGGISTSSGTSFAAPQVAGLAAGLWQANPSFTNIQIINMIRRSGTRFSNPSDSIGYGIPNYTRARVLATEDQSFDKSNITIYPNPIISNQLQIWFDEKYLGANFVLQLSDVLGRNYFSENIKLQNTNYQIDISKYHLPSGVYLVQIRAQGSSKVIKILK
jgi:subtilisin family serine protease